MIRFTERSSWIPFFAGSLRGQDNDSAFWIFAEYFLSFLLAYFSLMVIDWILVLPCPLRLHFFQDPWIEVALGWSAEQEIAYLNLQKQFLALFLQEQTKFPLESWCFWGINWLWQVRNLEEGVCWCYFFARQWGRIGWKWFYVYISLTILRRWLLIWS